MQNPNGYVHKEGLVYKNQYHVIFCPKYRRKVLVRGVDIRLKELLQEIAVENDVNLISMEVMPDHVHIFFEADPRQQLHMIVRNFKGRTSRILREEFPWLKSKIPSLWTRSYFSCTVGHINEETIQKYIEDQKGK